MKLFAEELQLKFALVTCRLDDILTRDECRNSLDQRLSDWILRLGFTPLLLTTGISNYQLELIVESIKPHLLVLSGGNTPGEKPERDTLELNIIKLAKERSVPLLGICRGMQMLGVAEGVSLKAVAAHSGCKHIIQGEISRCVNSYHQYALDCIPPGYVGLANTDDGCVEAIYHKVHPIMGIMWHPEREVNFLKEDIDFVLNRLFGVSDD
ncbi:gamma-glutamyl-gamma-aminobutyrate hydrolase family protein [Aeromonas diversa]|uniref:gamma-glutamyl-gamma-aminobutyrate hydrolase family protein n=1 Tax=Aeromonas diversa TaxID=502790 RepID=UPI00399FE99A